jgi:hypothetical protein
MKAAVDVETPSIGFARYDVSSTYTPGQGTRTSRVSGRCESMVHES